MEKEELYDFLWGLLQNKHIFYHLIGHHNIGFAKINFHANSVNIEFNKPHYKFKSKHFNISFTEFLEKLDANSKEKFIEILNNFENLNQTKSSIEIYDIHFSFSNNTIPFVFIGLAEDENVLKGIFIENLLPNNISENLVEYNEFINSALTSSNIFLWKWDFKNWKQVFSKGWAKWLGYDEPEDAFDYNRQLEMIHPEDMPRINEAIERHIKGITDHYQVEFRIRRKDGDYQWLLSKGQVVEYDENNEPLTLTGVHIDINEIVKLREEKEFTELKLASTLDMMEDIICIKDGEGRWMIANKADLELFQLTNVDYYGKTDYDLSFYTNKIYKEAFQTCMITDEAAWKKGTISRSDEIIPINDKGDVKIYDVIKKPVFNPDGSRKALIVVGRDVSEKRKVEKIERKLAHQNKLIREFAVQLLNQKSIDKIMDLLAKYLSELNNDLIVVVTKFTSNYVIKIAAAYPTKLLNLVLKSYPNLLEKFAMKMDKEFVTATIDKYKQFGVNFDTIFDATFQQLPRYIANSLQEMLKIKKIETLGIIHENEVYGFVSFFLRENEVLEDTDIILSLVYMAAQAIDRFKTYAKMQEAKKAFEISNTSKDKYFSVLAHDLEEPITNLLLMSDKLSKNFNTLPVSELKTLLTNLRDNIGYVNYLLENLLEWSKIEMNKIDYHPKYLPITTFYKNNESFLLKELSRKNLTLVNLLNPEHYVEVDERLTSIVFKNIINNSIKYTPRNGRIEIESFDVGKFIRIDVRDNGVGIEKENLPKLFSKDIKFSTLGTEGEEGSGLGLIIAQTFVKMQGGELHIESEKDKGTIVFFTLPKQL